MKYSMNWRWFTQYNYQKRIDQNEIEFNDKMSNTTIGKQLKQLLFMMILQH